jgi:hypothetical protein
LRFENLAVARSTSWLVPQRVGCNLLQVNPEALNHQAQFRFTVSFEMSRFQRMAPFLWSRQVPAGIFETSNKVCPIASQ